MEDKVKVFIDADSNSPYVCENNVKDISNCIIEQYRKDDIELCSFIRSVVIEGLDLEGQVFVYAILFEAIEDDRVIRIADGEEIDLADC